MANQLLLLAASLSVALGDGCACSGTTPCQYIGGAECFALSNANGVLRCPAQTEHCSCACSGATPCDANGVCVGTTMLYGKEVCSGVGVHCKSYEPATAAPAKGKVAPDSAVNTAAAAAAAAAAEAAQQCTCGGGTPCLSQQGTCVQMHATAGGALTCPLGATACDCDCGVGDVEHPCKYVDPSGGSFCFAHTGATLGGVTQCPAHTVRCTATATVAIASLATAAATTAAPNTQAYDANGTPAPTHIATNADGAKNCLYAGWSAWSTCSRKCGGGQQSRSAKVTQLPEQGGAACPLDQTQACNEQACDNVDCAISGWGEWSACSISGTRNGAELACGGGQKTREATILTHPKDYGAACPAKQAAPCNTATCYDELPRCQCDPFANYDGTQVQKDPLNPDRTIHTFDSNSDSTCSVDTYGRVQVHHPAPKFLHPASQSQTKGNAGGKVVCQHKDGTCKCCACHHLQCHSTMWGSWSTCAETNGGAPTQVRRRTMPGSTVVGEECAVATESRLCE